MKWTDFDEEINHGQGYPTTGGGGYTGYSTRKKMTRAQALKVRDVSKTRYGGYVYDYTDRQAAQEVLGDEYFDE